MRAVLQPLRIFQDHLRDLYKITLTYFCACHIMILLYLYTAEEYLGKNYLYGPDKIKGSKEHIHHV